MLCSSLLGAASGCIQRSLPLPPPSVSGITVAECPLIECPQGGVIVTLDGLALPDAQVIVEDIAPHASAPTGESLLVGTSANAAGVWRVVLGPVRVRGTMTVLAPRVGDTISLFQIQASPTNEVSLPRTLVVGMPR